MTEADHIDDMFVFNTKSKGKAKKAKHSGPATLSDDDEGEPTDETEVEDETLAQFEMRMNMYVEVSLMQASGSRDDYKKSGIVYDRRRKVISEFLKSLTKKKCGRCGA